MAERKIVQIAAARDGTVMGLASDGTLWRWTKEASWTKFPPIPDDHAPKEAEPDWSSLVNEINGEDCGY